MAAVGELALIADVVSPEAIGSEKVIAVVEHNVAHCNVILDDVLGLKACGNVFRALADIEQCVGIIVGNQRGQVQALKADCCGVFGNADAVIGLVTDTVTLSVPDHHTAVDGIEFGFSRVNKVGGHLVLVTAVDVKGIA